MRDKAWALMEDTEQSIRRTAGTQKRVKPGKRLLWGFFAAMGILLSVMVWSIRPFPQRIRTYYSGGKKVTETTSRIVGILPPSVWGFYSVEYVERRPGHTRTSKRRTLGCLGVVEMTETSQQP